MAVVKLKSDLFPDGPLSANAPDPAKARGRLIVATFSIANGAADSSGSTYKLASVPADALWDEATVFKVDGWGFAQVNIGTKDDIDALVTVTKATGPLVTPVAIGDAKHGLPIWQALGLPKAPDGGMIDIYAHASAAATGAGTMKGKIAYRFR